MDLSVEVRRDMGVIMEWSSEMCSAAMRDLNLILFLLIVVCR